MNEAEREATLQAASGLFDEGRYLAAHELFEELWEDTSGPDSAFYQGLLQAAVALHHLEKGNIEGADRLHSGSRRALGAYLPNHLGIDVERFLAEMAATLRPFRSAPPPKSDAVALERPPRLHDRS